MAAEREAPAHTREPARRLLQLLRPAGKIKYKR